MFIILTWQKIDCYLHISACTSYPEASYCTTIKFTLLAVITAPYQVYKFE